MHLILIAGMPGTGKTSVGLRLSRDLNIPMLSKDSFKEILFDTVGFRSRAEKVALSTGATDSMYYASKAILLCGGDVIIENNFDHAARPGALRLIKETGATPLTLLITCEFSALCARNAVRDRSPDRHRGHTINTAYPEPENPAPPPAPLPMDALREAMEARGFHTFDVGGKRIEVDTTDFDAFDYDSLLKTIKEEISV